MTRRWPVTSLLLVYLAFIVACTGSARAPLNDASPGEPLARVDANVALVDAFASHEQGLAAVDLGAFDPSPFAGQMLGAELLAPNLVRFSLFAPGATTVSVVGSFNAWDTTSHPLARDPASEVFRATFVVPNAAGQRYRFWVDGSREVPDPYSRANEQSGGPSIIVGTTFPWTDQLFERPERAALVIYELHVRDFTAHESSGVSAAERGLFSGLKQKIPYLERLGVNAVELMPVAENQSDGYSWGYNPALFFAPEAAYASSPDGAQVNELKALIDALHRAGISVIFDVVFNHISGQDGVNPLWDIAPLYYFDYDADGDPENDATPWGYKVANWRPMVKKLIYDNLLMWIDEYHVDGFRFDSTENMHADALIDVIEALDANGYGDRYFIFEEFSADHNQRIRAANARAGRALISSWGNAYKATTWSAIGNAGQLSLGPATYYSSDLGWRRPAAVINYFSSHDEGTLAARVGASEQEVKVAATHLLTSLGVPMIWSGDELLRLHYGNYHPAGGDAHLRPENNVIDWSTTPSHDGLIDYYAALTRLRIHHRALHLATQDQAYAHFVWTPAVDWNNAVGYAYQGVSGDNDFVVLINYSRERQLFAVPFPRAGRWHLMCDGQRATDQLPALGEIDVAAAESMIDVEVPAESGVILMSDEMNP